MRLSLEQCEWILERLGYYRPIAADPLRRLPPEGPERTYVSVGKVGGPKGIGVAFQQDATIDRDSLRAYLLDLGIDAEAVAEAFDALDQESR